MSDETDQQAAETTCARPRSGRLGAALRICAALTLLVAMAAGAPAAAQTAAAPERYQDAVSENRVQRDIRYAEPGETLDYDAAPEPAAEPDENGELTPEGAQAIRWTMIVLFAAALVFIIALFVQNATGVTVFGRKPQEGRRSQAETDDAPTADEIAIAEAAARSLDELRAMADRRLALSALLLRALTAATTAHDMRLGRSQTARDILRAIPRAWTHHPALARLVREAEAVVFGGREMNDPEFDACIDLAQPILAAGPAAAARPRALEAAR